MCINSDSTLGLLISGGLDSAILLGDLLRQGRSVQPFYIRSGLFWEKDELWALKAFLIALHSPALLPVIEMELPLRDVYGEHWSTTGRGVPDAATADQAVYLPGRNALLAIKPAIWCRLHGIEELALGVLHENPFGDATDGFFDSFETMLDRGTGGRVRIIRPLNGLSKREVLAMSSDLPLELTFSCIKPEKGLHCGRCNKCAERQAAFQAANLPDPTQYASPIPPKIIQR